MQTENPMYPYDYQDEDFFPPPEPPPRSPWRGIRNAFFALIMILALLGGFLYQASGIVPALLGYWSDDYQLVLTEVLTDNCTRGENVRPTQFEQPTAICVCGVLDVGDSTASLDFTLRQQNASILQHIKFYNQASGYFCREFTLDEALPEGTYFVIARPRFSREQVGGITFRISDERDSGANL